MIVKSIHQSIITAIVLVPTRTQKIFLKRLGSLGPSVLGRSTLLDFFLCRLGNKTDFPNAAKW